MWFLKIYKLICKSANLINLIVLPKHTHWLLSHSWHPCHCSCRCCPRHSYSSCHHPHVTATQVATAHVIIIIIHALSSLLSLSFIFFHLWLHSAIISAYLQLFVIIAIVIALEVVVITVTASCWVPTHVCHPRSIVKVPPYSHLLSSQ